jgi:hypothetical protein
VATHPAQHEQPKADPHKTGPAQQDTPPPRPQMEVGGTGTAKVSFTDEAGGDVKLTSAEWTSMGPVKIEPNDPENTDPTTVKLTATAPGRAPIKVSVVSESGAPAEAAIEIMVIETGTPVTGTIDVTIQPPVKTKAK